MNVPAVRGCLTCRAIWSDGAFTADCAECGGGAMERPCPVCDGKCGARWVRAVGDSNDSGLGHWAGGCKFPREEQQRLLRSKQRSG